MDDNSPGLSLLHISQPGILVHYNLNVCDVSRCLITLITSSDDKPSWKPRNVAWKEILSTDRDSHFEHGMKQNQICRLRPCSICSCNIDCEIVDGICHRLRSPGGVCEHMRYACATCAVLIPVLAVPVP